MGTSMVIILRGRLAIYIQRERSMQSCLTPTDQTLTQWRDETQDLKYKDGIYGPGGGLKVRRQDQRQRDGEKTSKNSAGTLTFWIPFHINSSLSHIYISVHIAPSQHPWGTPSRNTPLILEIVPICTWREKYQWKKKVGWSGHWDIIYIYTKSSFCGMWALEADGGCRRGGCCLFHSGREIQARENALPRVLFFVIERE